MSVCVPNPMEEEWGEMLTFSATVKLIFTILLSYPLAGVLKRLPDAEPAKKNLFMIGYGASLILQLSVGNRLFGQGEWIRDANMSMCKRY